MPHLPPHWSAARPRVSSWCGALLGMGWGCCFNLHQCGKLWERQPPTLHRKNNVQEKPGAVAERCFQTARPRTELKPQSQWRGGKQPPDLGCRRRKRNVTFHTTMIQTVHRNEWRIYSTKDDCTYSILLLDRIKSKRYFCNFQKDVYNFGAQPSTIKKTPKSNQIYRFIFYHW